MEKFVSLVGILLLTVSCSVNNVPVAKPTEEKLVSFYRFDGNPKDNKGAKHGVTNRVRYSALDRKNTHGIADFDGSESYLHLPDEFDFKDKTISFWVRAKEIPVEGAIIYVSDNPNLQHGLTVFALKQEGGNTNLIFNFSSQLAARPIEKGKWYHVAATLQDKTYRYYLNGKMISSGTFDHYTKSDNGYLTAVVGCSRTHDRFFNGSIDDLRIYRRALTEMEVAVLAIPD